jgi:predicted nucleic acid-binding protein
MEQMQNAVLLDCCTIIGALGGKPNAVTFKEKLSRRKDVTLLVPDLVVSEVSKIAKISAEAAEQTIRSFAHGNKVVRLQDDGALVDAIALAVRYDYCHYPDSVYLVHSRNTGAVLVTYDRKLRDVARMEGIMACSPDNFRFYK